MISPKLAEALAHLRAAVRHLESKQALSLDEYLRDWETRDVIERELEKGVQCCVDIGARLIALRGWRRAGNSHEIFDILAENGVIGTELVRRIKQLVGLRNVLAHEYCRIRNEEVHRHLLASPAVLREFAARIVEHCE